MAMVQESTAGENGDTDHEQRNVLVVDDEEDAAMLIKSYIDDLYNVVMATSGRRAMVKVDSETDVVLLDRDMPEMSGDEVLGVLREKAFDVQVGMITAIEPDSSVVTLPCDDYLTKPVAEHEVRALTSTLMSRAKYHELSTEFFRLVSKKKALEEAEKTHIDEYDQILQTMRQRREQIDEILNENTPFE